MNDSEKWLEAAEQLDSDAEGLRKAADTYRNNAATGIKWPHPEPVKIDSCE